MTLAIYEKSIRDVTMNDIKGIEDCIGCSAHNPQGECAKSPRDAKGNECPCRICLVKSMCHTGCNLFTQHKGY